MSVDIRPPIETDFDDLLDIIYNTFDDPDKFPIYNGVDRKQAELNLAFIKTSFVEQVTRIVSPNFSDEGLVLTFNDELLGVSGFNILDDLEDEMVSRYRADGVDLVVPSMFLTIAIRDPAEEYNRCGIGTKLTMERIGIAKDRGIKKIYVVVWGGSYSSDLMKKIGFKSVTYRDSRDSVLRRYSDVSSFEGAQMLELTLD